MRKSIGQLTSNQYYGGLVNKFVRRTNLLRRFGFKYTAHPTGGCSSFVRGKTHISVSTIHYAPTMAWIDTLKFALRQASYSYAPKWSN
jgi:hypothetical protein